MLARLWRIFNYKMLESAIRRYGMIVPAIVTREGIVVDGSRRVAVAKALGIKVPVIFIDAEVELVDPNILKICPVDLAAKKGGDHGQ